jgi:hypothetical protein
MDLVTPPEYPFSRQITEEDRMAKTLIGYPSEPSRKAMLVASAILAGASSYVIAKNRAPIVRAAAPVMTTLLVRPLAIYLTNLGII